MTAAPFIAVANGGLWWYRATPVRPIDGDTIEVVLDHGCSIRSSQRIRLLDVHAPERNQPGGPEATHEAAAWLSTRAGWLSWPLLVHTAKDRQSFNRYVADVYDAGTGDHLNEHMRRFIADHKEN